MSDSIPPEETSPPVPALPVAPTPPPRPSLNPAAVHNALGNEMRYEMVRLLSDGRCMSVTMLTEHFKADYENVSKHCRVLLQAGVIGLRAGGDLRCRWYEIPPACRTSATVIDYGVCLLRIA